MKNTADVELEPFVERIENKLIARVEGTLHAHTSEQRNRWVNHRPTRGHFGLPSCARWHPPTQLVARCSSAGGGGGTVM